MFCQKGNTLNTLFRKTVLRTFLKRETFLFKCSCSRLGKSCKGFDELIFALYLWPVKFDQASLIEAQSTSLFDYKEV